VRKTCSRSASGANSRMGNKGGSRASLPTAREEPERCCDRAWTDAQRSDGLGQAATVDAGGGGSGALTTTEREELAALRKENRQLRQEREILKRATAFFAKEGTS
jgi:transposase-like protein